MPSEKYEPRAVGIQRREVLFPAKRIEEDFLEEDVSG